MCQSREILSAAILFAFVGLAQAQIYKTQDEDNNTVYTDIPPITDAAEKVDLVEPNIADPVEVRPFITESSTIKEKSAKPDSKEPPVQVVGTADPEETRGEQRQENVREEVGDAIRPPVARPTGGPR